MISSFYELMMFSLWQGVLFAQKLSIEKAVREKSN